MDDLLAEFVAESREMLEALGGEIVAWEAAPADRARLDSIFRFVHTVKGNCGFFDLPRLEALSHAAEDALADVRAGRRQPDPALVSAVLGVIDRIADMVEAIDAGEPFPEEGDDALIRALEPSSEAAEEVVVPAPVESGSAARPAAAAQRSIRLPVELLDRVMSGVSDMVLARNDLARRLREVPTDAGVEGQFERLSAIIAEVRDAMTRTRMQRIETLFVALPRLVRDLSAELGKQVMVDIEGGDVELDREMIETVRDPLTHVIRNALDHGIETPAQRRAAGKREIGLLTLTARQSGNQIMIDIVDDGRGIDGQRLVDKAVAAGLIDAAEGARLNQSERCALIFEAGLSTAEAVTAISGRGVGMDVVRANIERVGGGVELDSTPGLGTRLTIRVPLTLSIIPALTIGLGGQRFAVPRSSIEEIVQIDEDDIELSRLGSVTLAMVRGRRLPCLSLSEVLQVPAAAKAATRLIVLRVAGGELFTLAVDELHDHEELVVKPVAPAVMATGLYAGTTLTDDGSPILLLDLAGIARAGGLSLTAHDRAARLDVYDNQRADLQRETVLLFSGLDGKRRAVRMAAVGRIDEIEASALQFGAAGARAVLDDRLCPLAGAGLDAIAADPAGAAKISLFRLSDGSREIAYAFHEVLDIAALDGKIVAAAAPGEIEGMTLIGGEPAEIVDAHWLFAQTADEPRARQAVCRLIGDDPWLRNFLRPLVEAAGYRIAGEGDEAPADIAISMGGDPAAVPPSGEVIHLRSSREDPGGGASSIYRYDREALMAAFAAARRRIAS